MARTDFRIAALLLSFSVLATACDGETSPRSGSEESPGISSASPSPSKDPGGKDGKNGDGKKDDDDDAITKRVPGGATFVVPPPKAEEMYMPETFGRGASDRVIIE